MKQYLLKISLPDGAEPLSAAGFRELVARVGDKQHPHLLPALFHFADGKPQSSAPPVRFIGGRSWVGLLAEEQAREVFDSAVGLVTRAVAEHYQSPVPISVRTVGYGLRKTQWPVHYYINDMAIKRRSQARRNKPIDELVREIVLKHLDTEAARCGFDLPSNEEIGLQFFDIKNIGMRLVTTTGKTNEYVSLVSARISAFVKLNGFWQVGCLRARGYGRIIEEWRKQ